jgi:hypothetical protein
LYDDHRKDFQTCIQDLDVTLECVVDGKGAITISSQTTVHFMASVHHSPVPTTSSPPSTAGATLFSLEEPAGATLSPTAATICPVVAECRSGYVNHPAELEAVATLASAVGPVAVLTAAGLYNPSQTLRPDSLLSACASAGRNFSALFYK